MSVCRIGSRSGICNAIRELASESSTPTLLARANHTAAMSSIISANSYSSLCRSSPSVASIHGGVLCCSNNSFSGLSVTPFVIPSSTLGRRFASFKSATSSASSIKGTLPPSSPIDYNPHSRLPLSSPRILTLDNLADNPGAKKKRIRWGRGRGGGRGKTCGRGQKGMKSKGRVSMPWFEGGQTILARRVPKYGFSNHMFKRKLRTLYVDKLIEFVHLGRIDASQTITMKTILDSNICGKHLHEGVKLLARKTREWKMRIPMNIEVADCSEGARKLVEEAGGTVKLVFYPRIALRALLKPEKFLPGRLPSLDAIPAPRYHWKYQEHIREVLKRRGEDLKPFEDEMKAWQEFQAKKNRKLQL